MRMLSNDDDLSKLVALIKVSFLPVGDYRRFKAADLNQGYVKNLKGWAIFLSV